MSKETNIAWCDSTINFWSGCTMVPIAGGLKNSGCLHCYAKTRDDRHMIEKVSHWGKGAPRLKHKGAVKDALALNRRPWVCDECGEGFSQIQVHDCCGGTRIPVPKSAPVDEQKSGWHRRRIFSLSLGDWLDEEVPIEWLAEMLDTIRQCNEVTWILCTKRPENFFPRIGVAGEHALKSNPAGLAAWIINWIACKQAPQNIILLASVENQAAADLRIPQLLKIPAVCRGLSLEPLLGPVDFRLVRNSHELASETVPDAAMSKCQTTGENLRQHVPMGQIAGTTGGEGQNAGTSLNGIDWLIIGGESGPGARPCNVDWIRSLVRQGNAAGAAVFVKQLGSNQVWGEELPPFIDAADFVAKKIDKKGGDPAEWPADLRVQEFPKI